MDLKHLRSRRRDHPRALRGRVGAQLGLRPDDRGRVRLHGEGAQAGRRARAHVLRHEGRARGRVPPRPPRPERDHQAPRTGASSRSGSSSSSGASATSRRPGSSRWESRQEFQGRGLDALLYDAITKNGPRDRDPQRRAVVGARDEHRDEQHAAPRRLPGVAHLPRLRAAALGRRLQVHPTLRFACVGDPGAGPTRFAPDHATSSRPKPAVRAPAVLLPNALFDELPRLRAAVLREPGLLLLGGCGEAGIGESRGAPPARRPRPWRLRRPTRARRAGAVEASGLRARGRARARRRVAPSASGGDVVALQELGARARSRRAGRRRRASRASRRRIPSPAAEAFFANARNVATLPREEIVKRGARLVDRQRRRRARCRIVEPDLVLGIAERARSRARTGSARRAASPAPSVWTPLIGVGRSLTPSRMRGEARRQLEALRDDAPAAGRPPDEIARPVSVIAQMNVSAEETSSSPWSSDDGPVELPRPARRDLPVAPVVGALREEAAVHLATRRRRSRRPSCGSRAASASMPLSRVERARRTPSPSRSSMPPVMQSVRRPSCSSGAVGHRRRPRLPPTSGPSGRNASPG